MARRAFERAVSFRRAAREESHADKRWLGADEPSSMRRADTSFAQDDIFTTLDIAHTSAFTAAPTRARATGSQRVGRCKRIARCARLRVSASGLAYFALT